MKHYRHGGVTKNGYHRQQIDDIRMLTHRRIIEEHINRPLSPHEIVHHINGNKLDNRIENLEIVTRSEHKKFLTINGRGLDESEYTNDILDFVKEIIK